MAERNLELSSRKEACRNKVAANVIRFDLNQILGHFSETASAIKTQFAIADELQGLGKVTEAEYIWRAQIIFLAGALDFYMHELTKFGLCEIYDNKWDETDKYNNIMIPMEVLVKALKGGEEADWFLEYINSYFQAVTMVSNDSIKSQFNLLGINYRNVADKAFYQQ